MRSVSTFIFLLFFANTLSAQNIDTVLTWRDYSNMASARIRVYDVVNDRRKAFAVVIDELGKNRGNPAINDASYVIQKIGKDLGIDPTAAYWVFRWSIGSFDVDCTDSKEVMMMATMGRSKSSKLTRPSWKVIDTQRLTAITDRRWLSG